MNEYQLNDALEFQDLDRRAIDDLADTFESRKRGDSLPLLRSWAAIRRRKNLDMRYVVLLPTDNLFLAIEGESMLPITTRTQVQWELTEEGNAWFKLANWPEATEAYLAAVQLAVLNLDLISATQNAANLALCCAAGMNPRFGINWSNALVDWAVRSEHDYRGSILAQAMTAGRACFVRGGNPEFAEVDGQWVVERLGHVSRVPFDEGCANSVANAMTAVGEVDESREWRRIMRLLVATATKATA